MGPTNILQIIFPKYYINSTSVSRPPRRRLVSKKITENLFDPLKTKY